MRKYLLSIPMILLLLVGAASAQVNFSLRGLDGNTYSASHYRDRGQVLILAIIGHG